MTYTFPKVFKLRESMSDSWAAGTGLKKMFSLFLRPPIVRMLAMDWALPYSCGVPMELGPKASRVRSVSFFSRLVASWSILLVTCGLLLGETLSSLLCVCTELPFLKTLRVFTFSVCDCFFSNSSLPTYPARSLISRLYHHHITPANCTTATIAARSSFVCVVFCNVLCVLSS